jgi:excinuclease ABC subunit B
MFNGDQARKSNLVEHGFRLPSAKDNRPLDFEEFLDTVGPVVFTTATPGQFELAHSGPPVQQVIRPTGLLDPVVEVRPLGTQVDDLMEEVRAAAEQGQRVLVTTLTKRTAEDLSDYLKQAGLRVEYLHSEIGALERVDILARLRRGEFDALVGINLLREGLDLPEVALVAILDADKEGFLRSDTSLTQTAGRAARHEKGRVILYADRVTGSMQRMLDSTLARREVQKAYNAEHGVVPQSTSRAIDEGLGIKYEEADAIEHKVVAEGGEEYRTHQAVEALEKEMLEAAGALEFERAAILRDELKELRDAMGEDAEGAG